MDLCYHVDNSIYGYCDQKIFCFLYTIVSHTAFICGHTMLLTLTINEINYLESILISAFNNSALYSLEVVHTAPLCGSGSGSIG